MATDHIKIFSTHWQYAKCWLLARNSAAMSVMLASMLLPVLLLLPALSGSSEAPGATCISIADAQCDLLLSVSVSSTPTSQAVLVEIEDALSLQLRKFLIHDSPCWTREGRLKLHIEEDNSRCQPLRVGMSYIICTQRVEDDCPRIVSGVRAAPLPRTRLRRQMSGGEYCLLFSPFYNKSVCLREPQKLPDGGRQYT